MICIIFLPANKARQVKEIKYPGKEIKSIL